MLNRILLAVVLAGLVGCGLWPSKGPVLFDDEVEVAPGKWLALRRWYKEVGMPGSWEPRDSHNMNLGEEMLQDLSGGSAGLEGSLYQEESYLSFQWDGKLMEWHEGEIPITLREHDGRMFLIGFDRKELHSGKPRLSFYGANDEGDGFVRIEARDFPRPIATQNMWLTKADRYVRIGDELVDRWDVLRRLDIGSRSFGRSNTAKIWYQIETGKELYEMPGSVPRDFLVDYVEKFKPIALPTILKEDRSSESYCGVPSVVSVVSVRPRQWLQVAVLKHYSLCPNSRGSVRAGQDFIPLAEVQRLSLQPS